MTVGHLDLRRENSHRCLWSDSIEDRRYSLRRSTKNSHHHDDHSNRILKYTTSLNQKRALLTFSEIILFEDRRERRFVMLSLLDHDFLFRFCRNSEKFDWKHLFSECEICQRVESSEDWESAGIIAFDGQENFWLDFFSAEKWDFIGLLSSPNSILQLCMIDLIDGWEYFVKKRPSPCRGGVSGVFEWNNVSSLYCSVFFFSGGGDSTQWTESVFVFGDRFCPSPLCVPPPLGSSIQFLCEYQWIYSFFLPTSLLLDCSVGWLTGRLTGLSVGYSLICVRRKWEGHDGLLEVLVNCSFRKEVLVKLSLRSNRLLVALSDVAILMNFRWIVSRSNQTWASRIGGLRFYQKLSVRRKITSFLSIVVSSVVNGKDRSNSSRSFESLVLILPISLHEFKVHIQNLTHRKILGYRQWWKGAIPGRKKNCKSYNESRKNDETYGGSEMMTKILRTLPK